MSAIYLIKRGAPSLDRTCVHPSVALHPVVICDRLAVARWEAGYSGDQSTVWEAEGPGYGMLMVKWRGLNLDYGHLVRSFTLPDGTECEAIYHDHGKEPWTLLQGAVWWSVKRLPEWLAEAGGTYPADEFTRSAIRRGYDVSHSRGDGRARKPWDELPDQKLAPWIVADP